MVKRRAVIRNKLGMHARAAVKFVQMAGQYQSEIYVGKDGDEVNGKSIMGLLTLVAALGAEIEIRAEGPDEAAAVDSLCALVASGFGEGIEE